MHFFALHYINLSLHMKHIGEFNSYPEAYGHAVKTGMKFEMIIDEATAADWMREFNIYCKETQANKGVNNNA